MFGLLLAVLMQAGPDPAGLVFVPASDPGAIRAGTQWVVDRGTPLADGYVAALDVRTFGAAGDEVGAAKLIESGRVRVVAEPTIVLVIDVLDTTRGPLARVRVRSGPMRDAEQFVAVTRLGEMRRAEDVARPAPPPRPSLPAIPAPARAALAAAFDREWTATLRANPPGKAGRAAALRRRYDALVVRLATTHALPLLTVHDLLHPRAWGLEDD